MSIAKPDGTSEACTYSDDGLRKSKVVGATTTQFTWDEQNLLLETDNSKVLQDRYTDYPGYWGGLSSQRIGSNSSFFGFDSQGSTRVLTAANGSITDAYSYNAFGHLLNAGSGTVNPFLYVGLFGYYADDPESYYVRARWLKAQIARWLSLDPIALVSSMTNGYQYCENSPLSFFDPFGLGPAPLPGILPVRPVPRVRPSLPKVIRLPRPKMSGMQKCGAASAIICIADACYELWTFCPGHPTGPIGQNFIQPIIDQCYPEEPATDPGEKAEPDPNRPQKNRCLDECAEENSFRRSAVKNSKRLAPACKKRLFEQPQSWFRDCFLDCVAACQSAPYLPLNPIECHLSYAINSICGDKKN